MLHKLRIEAIPDDRRAVFVRNSNYPPLGYVPQALGIAVARLFTRSVLLQFYAARLANLAAWLVLVWAALRWTPYFALAFAILALSPVALFVASTCTADAVTNGLAFLFTALVMRLAVDPAPATRRAVLGLRALGVALALGKLAYTPLLLLLLAVPAERVGGRSRQLRSVGALVIVSALAVLVWLFLARWELVQGAPHRGVDAVATNAAAMAQDPLRVANLVTRAVVSAFGSAPASLVETIWFTRPVGLGLAILLLVAWLCALLADDRRGRWPGLLERSLALGVAVATVAGIALVAFLVWTEGGAPDISGLQARYFVPLLPALTLAVCPPARVAAPPRVRRLLGLLALALTTTVLLRTVQRGLRLWD